MGIYPSVFIYTTVIQGFCNTGKWEDAKGILCEMMEHGVPPNEVFSALIQDGKRSEASRLLEFEMERGDTSEADTCSILMHALGPDDVEKSMKV